MKRTIIAIAGWSLISAGCMTSPTESGTCPRGEVVQTSQGVVCIYQGEIVIETGFDCPPDFPFAHPVDDKVVCSSDRNLPDDLAQEALDNAAGVAWPVHENHGYAGPPLPPAPRTGTIDLLWVIDNSGSMCHRQEMIQDNIDRLVDRLEAQDIDFHMAVTTTHMKTLDEFPFELVAKPGHFQSTPQPVPGFDPSCYYGIDEAGNLVLEDMNRLLASIERAVTCTSDPLEWQHLLERDLEALRCALDASRWNCASSEIREREAFFPPPEAYREIPTVLRAEDYRDETGALDVARLKADFTCMSMVGTRGYGFEQGLLAAVTALSPELIAGPNAGFLRNDAPTGIIFVSDDNDCSHDGLDERTSCGVAQCTFDENDEVNLLPVTDVKATLLQNLSEAKGRAVEASEVLVASFHGAYQRYTEPSLPHCPQGFDIPASCATSLGKAYSGHRYDAFIRQFPRHFPTAEQPNEPLPGLICDDFSDALGELGELFEAISRGDE